MVNALSSPLLAFPQPFISYLGPLTLATYSEVVALLLE